MPWIFRVNGKDVDLPLTHFRGRSRPFYILYPHNRHLSAKVRALVDLLVSEIGGTAD